MRAEKVHEGSCISAKQVYERWVLGCSTAARVGTPLRQRRAKAFATRRKSMSVPASARSKSMKDGSWDALPLSALARPCDSAGPSLIVVSFNIGVKEEQAMSSNKKHTQLHTALS